MLKFFFVCFLPLAALCHERPIVILDAGHGGKDRGARVQQLTEKTLTLQTCYLTKQYLEALGYRVVMTRARDVFLPLTARVALANRRDPSLFVSIHYNSALSPVVKGIEVYYYGRGDQMRRRVRSQQLARQILSHMALLTKGSCRGVKHGNFQVIRETTMPAVLVEAAFLTNREERQSLASPDYLDKLAKGIALGIDQYVKQQGAG